MIKNQQGYDAATDGRIRKIEYRTEKNKMLPSHPWHPFRPISVDDGEIKHVYHTTVEQAFIPRPERYEMGRGRCGRIVEYQSVEHAVYDISRRPGQNQRQTDDKTRRHAFAYRPVKKIRNDDHGYDTKGSQKKLVEKFPPECHAGILRKENVKPIGHTNTLVQIHVGLDCNLNPLVYDKHQEDNQQSQTPLSEPCLLYTSPSPRD